ncbi:uncharacterized protein PRCAT00003362001 [Priceomyces carsonii]|uniref:uncharacterized protein n=1 Tax=Priceomyces carsonii TaxID=28549 RepID=UPI002ED7D43D|nr:unnamed protein product [Priceomyces carsonii]
MSELKEYTFDEIALHNTRDDLWIVYNGKVYDVSPYIDEHPGGEEVILDVAGIDATEAFNDIGHSDDAHDILKGLLIGTAEGAVVQEIAPQKHGETTSTVSLPLVAVLVFLIAFGAYYYLQNK